MSAARKTILIVDDDEPTRKLLDALMRRNALSSVAASDGRTAIELIESRPDVGCVILDLMMPAVDGTSVIHHLARTNRGIPVIVCTAMLPATIPDLDRNIVRAIIRKPFDVEEMAATVKALIA